MASALEHFVSNVTALLAQGNFNDAVTYINNSNDILTKNVSHLDTVLATLHPATHSLGVLAVLRVRLQNTSHTDANIDTLHATVAEFVNVCSEEQIRCAPNMFAELCGCYSDLLIAGNCPMRGIEVIKTAILKLQKSPIYLTSLHTHLMHLCLSAKCFKPAMSLLDIDIMDINKEMGHYDVKHFLLYYYYGGMICTAVKNYERARYFFKICVSTPALSVSHIMLEAFKKYILISLMIEGKIGKIPKYASLIVTRYFKSLCQAYWEFGVAFITNVPEKLNAVVEKYRQLYIREQNYGLIKQCVDALYKKNIQRLTRTFLTLSLTDVANRVHLESHQLAQKYILNMIEDGEIYASINQKDGMVVFLSNPEKYNCPEMMNKLDEEMNLCMKMTRRIVKMEEEIVVNPLYVQKSFEPQDDEGVGPAPSAPISSFHIASPV